ncbi:MAG: PilZ domain-containing protein [Candidatus Omnitrophota bacterium]
MGATILDQREEVKTERRKYARVATNLYIAYSLPGSESQEAGVFITKNVSGGGMLFESLREVAVGTLFDLAIHLPTSPLPLLAKGKVVRVKKTRPYGRYDVGVSLVEIHEEDRRELVQYLVATLFTKSDCESLFGKRESSGKTVGEEPEPKEVQVTL